MWHVQETGEGHTGCWCRDPTERDHLKGIGIDGRMKLKWIFRKWDGGGRKVDWSGLG